MNFKSFLLATVYGIMFCGWGAIWIAERFDPLLMLSVAVLLLIGVRADSNGKHWLKPSWNRQLLFVGVAIAIADWRLGSRVWFLSIVLLLLYVGVVRALSPKANRDLQQMLGLGFLQLLAASVLTVDLAYGFFFLTFFILIPWAFLAVAIKAELDGEHDMLRGAVASAGAIETPFGAERMLSRGALLSMLLALGMTMAITVAFFAAFPRLSTGMISGRIGLSANVSGFSESVKLGGSGSILEDSSPAARLVAVVGDVDPDQLYLRGIALDVYDGEGWRSSSETRRVRAHNGRMELRSPVDRADLRSLRIILEDLGTNLLLLPQLPFWLDTPAPQYDIDARAGVVRVPNFQGGFRYEVRYDPDLYWREVDWRSVVAHPNLGQDQALMALLALPDAALLPAEIFRHRDDATLAWLPQQLAEFANYNYSLELPDHERPLFDFFERRAGHCEMFATALTLMLRAAGVPAVLVNGFRGAETMDDYFLVRQRNAHTWVEVIHPQLGSLGIPLDPTPPLPPVTNFWQQSQEIWQRGVDRLMFFWMDRVVSYDMQTQVEMLESGKDAAAELRVAFRAQRDALRRWLQALGAQVFAIAGVVVAALFLWLFLRLWRRGQRQERQQGFRRPPAWLRGVVSALEKRHGRRPLHQPLADWAKSQPLSPDQRQFLQRYETWRYGGQGDARALKAEARRIKNALAREPATSHNFPAAS